MAGRLYVLAVPSAFIPTWKEFAHFDRLVETNPSGWLASCRLGSSDWPQGQAGQAGQTAAAAATELTLKIKRLVPGQEYSFFACAESFAGICKVRTAYFAIYFSAHFVYILIYQLINFVHSFLTGAQHWCRGWRALAKSLQGQKCQRSGLGAGVQRAAASSRPDPCLSRQVCKTHDVYYAFSSLSVFRVSFFLFSIRCATAMLQ